MKTMDKFVDTSEALVRIVGKGVAWLVLVSAFVISYDVVNRYILGRATDWGYDVAWMLYATSFIFGAAYTLQEGSHVRVDPIYQKIPEKARAYVDIVISVVFILPTVLTLTYFGVIYAYESWEVGSAPHTALGDHIFIQ